LCGKPPKNQHANYNSFRLVPKLFPAPLRAFSRRVIPVGIYKGISISVFNLLQQINVPKTRFSSSSICREVIADLYRDSNLKLEESMGIDLHKYNYFL
jgi:hypothetical protein